MTIDEVGIMPVSPVSDTALVARVTLEKEESEPPQEIPTTAVTQPTHKSSYEYVRLMVIAAFPDAPIMVHIADSESDFKPDADNPNSTAYGVFQILIGTWNDYDCTGDRGNPADNIACARKIYDARGTKDWNASKHEWGKYL